MKTQKEVRSAFWDYLKEVAPKLSQEYKRGKRQNDYNATIRSCFCGFVDSLQKDGIITEKLAYNVTL